MSGYGTLPVGPTLQLAEKPPAAFLDYTESVAYPLTNPFTCIADPLVSLSLSMAPSGDGEMTPSRLSVDSTGFLVTWWLASGVPGRNYIVNLLGTTAAGRIFQWDFGIVCTPLFATYPLPLAPVPGFGAAITWVADGTLTNFGGYLALSTLGEWPTSSAGLLPGSLYAASNPAAAYIYAVVGFGHVDGPPVFLNSISGAELLALGAVPLPPTDPHVLNQIWINGDILCVSLG